MRRVTAVGIGVMFAGAMWFDAAISHRWLSTVVVLVVVLLALLGPTWLGPYPSGGRVLFPYRYRAGAGAAMPVLSLSLWDLGYEVTMIASACVGVVLLTYRAPWSGRPPRPHDQGHPRV